MAAGKIVSKLGREVVEAISDLLTRANKKFDPKADPTPEPETLEYQAEELGEQFKALLETGTPEEVKRNLEFYDPDTLMTSAMKVKKPEFGDEFQESQWVLSSPETHRKLNLELWYDDPKHALENLKIPKEKVDADIDKVIAYDISSKKAIPESGQRSYEGWRQLPMYRMEYDPYSNALFVRQHEGRHINRALELQGKGQLNYLTEIDKLGMDEFPDLKTLDPNTPVFSDSRRQYIDAEGNRRFTEPEKVGTLGDLFKVVYGAGGIGSLPELESYLEEQGLLTP